MSDTCAVFFQSQDCDLEDAVKSLEKYRFDVSRDGDKLVVSREKSPQFQVVLNTDSHVLEEAMGISEGTEFFDEMSKCNARFEVIIENLEQALGEINTLMEVQGALQDASNGYLFLPWNGNISRPWVG